MTTAKWIGAIGAAVTMFVAPAAFAGELSDGKGGYGSVGALIGAGTADYATFGIGVRGGYTFANTPVYVGGTLLYHFGTSYLSSLVLGVEGGYDITVGPVIIRPYLGLGDAIVYASIPTINVGGISVGGGSANSGHFAFWPGGTVMYPINNFFVGGDMRLQIITDAGGGEAVSFGIFGTGGIAF
jgi:hypothetical protein